ncbi:hypothetical protein GCM10023085_09990 [Actinomadura viridis]|uniref:Uncharacterized protein n=1 Tax=Actinomadura viridis TaxID=58110 RepID=A0A931DRD7_9ACTN|nr:hypothetical protein [Actinomadura viridis]MBG6092010.1 hypothetical protein [Actinomadura viridis]
MEHSEGTGRQGDDLPGEDTTTPPPGPGRPPAPEEPGEAPGPVPASYADADLTTRPLATVGDAVVPPSEAAPAAPGEETPRPPLDDAAPDGPEPTPAPAAEPTAEANAPEPTPEPTAGPTAGLVSGADALTTQALPAIPLPESGEEPVPPVEEAPRPASPQTTLPLDEALHPEAPQPAAPPEAAPQPAVPQVADAETADAETTDAQVADAQVADAEIAAPPEVPGSADTPEPAGKDTPDPAGETPPDSLTTHALPQVTDDTPEPATPEPTAPAVPQDTDGLRAKVSELCDALIEFYEGLERDLREKDQEAVGWRPHLTALQAMREERTAGGWDGPARLLVESGPSAVTRDATVEEIVRDVLAKGERTLVLAPTAVRAEEIVQAAGPEVFALLVREEQAQAAVTPSPAPPAVPPVTHEPVTHEPVTHEPVTHEPVTHEPTTEATAVDEPAAGAMVADEPFVERRPARDASTRTVEFKPLTSAPDVTRPQEIPPTPDLGAAGRTPVIGEPAAVIEGNDGSTTPLPDAAEIAPEPRDDREQGAPGPQDDHGHAPETRTRSVTVRPVGEAWRQAWATEARMLQRGLMWLEQWPRDRAALDALKDARERRRQELDAEVAGLAARIEELKGAVETAGSAGEQASADAERLRAAEAEIEAELAEPLAEARRLQEDADATAEEAGRFTRIAEATLARCAALDQRDAQARAELQAARQQEEALTADLAKARDDLPRAVEEADRLVSESAAADAEGHARYYRLAAAESALAARRRKMTLGQRLHVAAPPPEIKDLRAEVKALTRGADEAARRANDAKEAAERAHGYRTQLEAFIQEGGARLAAARQAQEQLGAELVRLATERERAAADHREKAGQSAAAVEQATRASALAVEAQRVAHEIQGRLAGARQAHEAARAAYERAGAEAEAARTALAEAEALLARRRVEAEEELSSRSAEFDAATAAEARSRENVQEICGAERIDMDLLATHQDRAMARIERLSTYLRHETGHDSAEDAGQVLLRTADLVCGTPLGVGAAAGTEDGAEFDVLVVADAGALNAAEFLIGAVRARRWVLLDDAGSPNDAGSPDGAGSPDERPPAHREYPEYAGGGRLLESPFRLSRP